MAKLAGAFAVGIIFGFTMEKAKVYEPITIRQQMILKDYTMVGTEFFPICFRTKPYRTILILQV
jgi:hypothetical protein